MKESQIKELFKMLINTVIIPEYPFLELHSMQSPSESVNPRCAVFYTTLTTSKELTYQEVKKIKSEIYNLFKSAGFSSYSFRDASFWVRVDIGDKKTGDIYQTF